MRTEKVLQALNDLSVLLAKIGKKPYPELAIQFKVSEVQLEYNITNSTGLVNAIYDNFNNHQVLTSIAMHLDAKKYFFEKMLNHIPSPARVDEHCELLSKLSNAISALMGELPTVKHHLNDEGYREQMEMLTQAPGDKTLSETYPNFIKRMCDEDKMTDKFKRENTELLAKFSDLFQRPGASTHEDTSEAITSRTPGGASGQ